jgi:hypothetical protein
MRLPDKSPDCYVLQTQLMLDSDHDHLSMIILAKTLITKAIIEIEGRKDSRI